RERHDQLDGAVRIRLGGGIGEAEAGARGRDGEEKNWPDNHQVIPTAVVLASSCPGLTRASIEKKRFIQEDGFPGQARQRRLIGERSATHSSLMLAILATCDHFRVSAARKAANACGGPGRTSAPSLAKAAITCGDAKLALIAELSLMTMSCAVAAGATTPI